MKSFNQMEAKGMLHSYALEERDTDTGTAIMGTVTLQVDNDGTLVEGRYYATPQYSSGKVNRTYGVLEDIMTANYKTVVDDGEGDWLGLSGNIDVSYFAGRNGAVKTIDDLVRSQKMRGSFINMNKKKEFSNKWNCDLYITKIDDVEADPEKGTEAFVRVRGYIVDDYRKRLDEVAFEARNAAAMNYIRSLPASVSEPYAVGAWGSLLETKVKSIKKSAFGDDEIREFDRQTWTITGMSPEPYSFGEEGIMTPAEWKQCKDGLDENKKAILIKIQSGGDEGATGGATKLAF